MVNKFLCHDCQFLFHISSKPTKKGKLFCPNCGDCISVEKIDKTIERKPWTTKEESLIDEIITGTKTKYQVAALTGRTYKAVQKRYELHMKSAHA